MASKKIVKPNYQGSLADYKESLKPASSKKEQLYGQELGKIGRAAERGGPVNTVQKEHGEYSEKQMYANKMKNMPFKQKLTDLGIQLTVSAATNPNTLRGITNTVNKGVSAIQNLKSPTYYGIHGSPTEGLKKITPALGQNTQQFLKGSTNIGTSNVNKPAVFSLEPKTENVLQATDYAQKFEVSGKGSVYVVKGKAKNVISHELTESKNIAGSDLFAKSTLSNEKLSNKPMKVVKEFKVADYTKTAYNKFDDAMETTQDFSPLSAQIQAAIKQDSKKIVPKFRRK
jgi:hypothetical protein